METPEHYLKFVQSLKTPERRQEVILVFLLLTFTHYYGLSIVDFEQVSVGLVGIILFSSKFCKFLDAIDYLIQSQKKLYLLIFVYYSLESA